MRATDNLHVREMAPLTAPRVFKERFPLTDAISQLVYETRSAIIDIMQRRDPRLVVIVGPCSIHDGEAALEYARRLVAARERYGDRLVIVMRTYLEKPRTTTGWRGLINDPHLDGSFDMSAGLGKARELLLAINALGMPVAAEMLDPISPQYISDVVSFAAIGARTVESQTHRAMASGLSMPVGFKNSTDGNIDVAVNSILSARHPHSFLGIDQDGVSCVVKTSGNPAGLVILRGSRGRANYDAASIAYTTEQLRAVGIAPALMVDCSHANSDYDHTRQAKVWNAVLRHHIERRDAVIGMMLESNLFEGKQPIPADLSQLRYGVSVTDACIGWETTEELLAGAYELLSAQR